MKIFVTGGAGFIGSHLCLRLAQMGHEVTAFDNLLLGREEFLNPCRKYNQFKFIRGDLLDLTQTRQALKGHEFVYHLAANSDILGGQQSTDRDLKLGTLATYNLLEAMRLEAVKQLAFASTSAIYGEATIKPTAENYGPLLPISLYGASKLACEAMISAFSHCFSLQTWIFRFANVVGGNATHGAIYDFIQRLKKDPSKLQVLGNGRQKKSYLHVSDCVGGMVHAVSHAEAPVTVLNLASRGVTEVRWIAEETIRQMQLDSKLEFGTGDRGWPGDVPYTWLDGSKIEELNWHARFESNEAVRQAILDILSDRDGAL